MAEKKDLLLAKKLSNILPGTDAIKIVDNHIIYTSSAGQEVPVFLEGKSMRDRLLETFKVVRAVQTQTLFYRIEEEVKETLKETE